MPKFINEKANSYLIDNFMKDYIGPDETILHSTLAEFSALLLPEYPVSVVRRVANAYLYAIFYSLYIHKRKIHLPHLGFFFARWRKEYRASGFLGERIVPAQWEFRFRPTLMDSYRYNRFYDIHKQSSIDLLGITHAPRNGMLKSLFMTELEEDFDEIGIKLTDSIRELHWSRYSNEKREKELALWKELHHAATP